MNPGGAWSKDYLVFDLDTIRQNKDARRIRVHRCGEIFQKRGLPTFPTKTMEAEVTPVPPADTASMPEVLRTDPISQPSSPAPPAEVVQPAKDPALPAEEAKPPVKEIKEAAAEPPAVVPLAPPAKPYTAGQFIDPSTYDASRVLQA